MRMTQDELDTRRPVYVVTPDGNEVHWFESRDMSGLDLSKQDYTRAMFLDCNLTGARMVAGKFADTSFQECKLDGILALGCNFSETQMNKVSMKGARLSGANFRQAQLPGIDLYKAQMHYTILFKAHMVGACLRKAHLFGADLREVYFGDVDLKDAVLDEANIQDAVFHKANIVGMSGQTITRMELGGLSICIDKASTRFGCYSVPTRQILNMTQTNLHLYDCVGTYAWWGRYGDTIKEAVRCL